MQQSVKEGEGDYFKGEGMGNRINAILNNMANPRKTKMRVQKEQGK